ncbi:hypothetical protein EUTSA_v10009959mg, partial [Eutrema salsugineum]
MVRICDFPDDLLLKILSFLPTQVAASTSVLSKRWEFLWMLLPKLEYIDRNYLSVSDCESLRLCLDLPYASPQIKPEDIKRFYTCKSIVVLKLGYLRLMDVPSTACLPSLKTLTLNVRYDNEESLQRLLSICPVLEELNIGNMDDLQEFSVIVPTLRRLSLLISNYSLLNGYVIDTPSLEYFRLEDRIDTAHKPKIRSMPNLKEAYVEVVSFDLKSLIRSITSVKRLTLCSE